MRGIWEVGGRGREAWLPLGRGDWDLAEGRAGKSGSYSTCRVGVCDGREYTA